MKESEYLAICQFMQGVWGRELTTIQKKHGWTLLKDLPDEAVGEAITAIANEGEDRPPPWPVVAKTARTLWEAQRMRLPQLPGGDGLTEAEHRGVMIELRALETPEQRRRADRVTGETKGLPMSVRLVLAGKLLRGDGGPAKLPPATWDALFDDAVEAAFKEHPQLLARETHV